MLDAVNLIGWGASILVLVSYWVSARVNRPNIFHWGNVVGAILLVPVQIMSGVPFAALLSGSFGVIAAQALWRQR